MSEDGIPIRLSGKTFKVDFRELFISALSGLAKTFLAVKSQGASLAITPNILSDFVGVLRAFKRDTPLEYRAWLLISGAALFALEKLISETKLKTSPSQVDLARLADDIATRVETRTYTLEPDFFSHPNGLRLLDDIAHEASSWIAKFGAELSPAAATAIFHKYFPSGLHRVWLKDAALFKELETALSSPFVPFLKISAERDAYLQYIEDDFTSIRLIGQEEDDPTAVRLAQVFVPLRAFFEEAEERKNKRNVRRPDSEEARTRRHVVELFDELNNWINRSDRRDPLRIISGGPGIGKSSSMRAFAAYVARDESAYPLFIPLQKLGNSDRALKFRLDSYLTESKAFSFGKSPLDIHEVPLSSGPILLIFDGLDELVRPGKDADEIAREFIFELQRLLETENYGLKDNQPPRVIAIVAGRIAAAGSAAKALKQSGRQVLHLLRYVEDRKYNTFFDPNRLLKTDQRKTWWNLWQNAATSVPHKIPKQLLAQNLFEITVEPMLLYFIAFVRPWEHAQKGLDRNALYNTLLRHFYMRECSKGDRNFATEFQTFEEYELVLQAMAMAAWYDGSTRNATIESVISLLTNWNLHLANALKNVIGSSKPAVGAALAFYMRPGEQPNSFEFIHKTFAEYLVARRVVAAVRSMAATLPEAHDTHRPLDDKFDTEHQLLIWLKLLGPRAFDHDLVRFVRDEVDSYASKNDKSPIPLWRRAILRCIRSAIEIGMPAHQLFVLSAKDTPLRPQNFRDATDQAKNSEEALWVILNATILPFLFDSDYELVEVTTPPAKGIDDTVNRLRPSLGNSGIHLELFDGLNLEGALLGLQNLFGMRAFKTNLSRADMVFSNLGECDFRHAKFVDADLFGCIAFGSDFSDADFTGAQLSESRFQDCALVSANFSSAGLEDAVLVGNDLSNAIFLESDLRGANLSRAVLKNADFRGANLEKANLTGADLSNANLAGAKLDGAVLGGAKGIEHNKSLQAKAQTPSKQK